MYSLVEIAKANGLRVYEYLEYVLTELAAHQDDTSRDFLADLLPWSKVVLFFATPNYQKMQNAFPKVAAGNSSFLHVPPA